MFPSFSFHPRPHLTSRLAGPMGIEHLNAGMPRHPRNTTCLYKRLKLPPQQTPSWDAGLAYLYKSLKAPPRWAPRVEAGLACLYKSLKPPRGRHAGIAIRHVYINFSNYPPPVDTTWGIPGWRVYINCSTSNRRRRRIMSAPSRTRRMCDEANSYPALLEKSVIFLHQRRSLS